MADWNEATIQEFHSKAGKGVGPFGDHLMLLTTVGARSGEERLTTPGGTTTSRRIPRLGWR